MGAAIKRLAIYIVPVLFGFIFLLRLCLDLVGWSTVPDDLDVAMTRLDQALGLVLSFPWPILFLLAVGAQAWLMYATWPSAQTTAANLPTTPHIDTDLSPPEPIKKLSSIHYDIAKARTAVSREIENFPGSRSLNIKIDGHESELSIETAARVRSVCGLLRKFGISTPNLGSAIRRDDAIMIDDYFLLALPFVGNSQVDELKDEAARFIQERQKPSQ